jgi:ubiquinone/menaquinone biosynthesis C-methylase UbiE
VPRPRTVLLFGGLAVAGISYWTRKNPSACPYAFRLVVQGPHPGIPRKRLLEALSPQPGERILEIGPGTGHYSLDIASRLDGGTLAIFDIQQKFLDHTVRAGRKRGLTNIKPTLGDAQRLPFKDERFDGAYLVTVLGEIPDSAAGLRELHRVLKPGGRLVVGETMFGDPHVVTSASLRKLSAEAGFTFEEKLGSRLGYFARLRK